MSQNNVGVNLIDKISIGASLRETVGSRIAAAIISGELRPLQMVSVRQLALLFGVSGTPVREAMLDLEKRGFVESVRNRGFRITELNFDHLTHLVEVRRWLECPAMEQVAGVYLEVEHRPFEELAGRIVTSAEEADFAGFLSADAEFHLGLLSLTGNDVLVNIVSDLRAQTRLVGLHGLANTSALHATADEHFKLLRILAQGDGASAGRLMHVHIGHVIGLWAGRPEGGDEKEVEASASAPRT